MKYICFKELPYCDSDSDISIIESKGMMDKKHIDDVLRYLRGGRIFSISPGLAFDIFSNAKIPIGTLEIYTDGEWCWYSDLIYYIEKYHISLPLEFMNKMESKKWICDCNNIDISNTELD
ncbi:hypothetical protein ACW2B0_005158 [Escherichia coli]|uniref:hypothetical protein n=1 Tax=Enterobacteriaceae TaxID=543 RepID=UPI0006815DB4|nr:MULTISPECIES: hypothetical protein [Enterobacteriaceae]EFN8614814.1 hypothetical protein [Escherichia coli O41:H45]EET8529786.1 hypothetical protein [Escherichia coli]EEU0010200.1 hypothetical protein [Escherichia coli]EEW8454621.1 hypothetical protein [Escherichia coli]EEX2912073.1 hypothetical protein [Escherichia coli]